MFGRGDLAHFEPIEGGIENSNYRVLLSRDDQDDDYILTIIEHLGFDEVPFFNKVMAHLYHQGLPVAAPIATLDGMTSTIFCGKPAFLFPKLDGSHLERVSESQCREIGHFMARSHQAWARLTTERDNPYHPGWMRETLEQVSDRLTEGDRQLLRALIREYEDILAGDLPQGIIHGDLFKDNALFRETGTLSGVIDFYHACNDLLIQDIAIAINDWCVNETDLSETLREALLTGYQEVRSLTVKEHQLLAPMQRVSAARFALTRLLSGDPPLKDPTAMLRLARSLA